ncbi:RagB/SusD family nutrient uptake outer membrane protein [Chitinophaga varians]|uniref:RagB/SusD family nutrient uptake outer membrane protein n=1 Tax=Chitinophaga varians TaxID=2202339 RepID=A0A847SB28_9BACT|nr:RagB/SusD family nutrient uptake outer membrane protein [Chitinophaga varians]NLR68901.1 RagB/SusD family nutrient uptake outer membrane protein [Chitinophaga varians]
MKKQFSTSARCTFVGIAIQYTKEYTANTILFCVTTILLFTSCKKFVDVGSPSNKITTAEAFKDDANATSAVRGLYSQILATGLSPANGGITIYTGLASDELRYTGTSIDLNEFNSNAISSTNSTNRLSIWYLAYQAIYQANSCIEGITGSTGISANLKDQLLGESKFMRGFWYFYLTQLYGDVPLITTSDYNLSGSQGRSPSQEVYKLMLSDLDDAQKLLRTTYPSDGRLRPNRFTANALLSRIYLYIGNWKLAEDQANSVINSATYTLTPDLSKVFLAGSTEAIWQLSPTSVGANTREGATFLPTNSGTIPTYVISESLMNTLDTSDPRKKAWIGSKIIGTKTYYFPFKYKANILSTITTEHYMMFRLAEQYLIRAEARIRQGNIEGGISDLNVLRSRARGNNNSILPDYPKNATVNQALSYVLAERQIELITEWGNRWFDLKRFHLSGIVLKPLKLNWKETDTLLPIPAQEILLNKNLTQNNGYN